MQDYMMSPLDLTERQLLIYMCLYKRCNFKDMKVDMTIKQIQIAITIVDLTEKVIYSEIQKMIKKGYLIIVSKASKGNAPVYEIVKINEIEVGKPTVNQRETNEKPKPSDCNKFGDVVGSQRETNGKPKVSTIKEKEKEKEKDIIYSRVITRLNDVCGKNFKASTQKTKSLIEAKINDGFTEEDFYKVIEVKAKEWIGTEWDSYLRPITLFGPKFESYLNQKEKTPSAKGEFKNNSVCDKTRKDGLIFDFVEK